MLRLFPIRLLGLQGFVVVLAFSGHVLTGVSGETPHANGFSGPDIALAPYTAVFNVRSQWLNASGEVKEDVQLTVNVFVTQNQVVIEPKSVTNSNLVFMIWCSSPVRSEEWISYTSSTGPTGRLDVVLVDNHPTLQATDLYANLGRILYVPTNHPAFAGVSEGDRLYMAGESSSYRPDEVDFKTQRRSVGEQKLASVLTASSPDYYYDSNGRRKAFGGPPYERKLWSLSVDEYSNWHSMPVPGRFRYVRYQDPGLRAKSESDIPIVLCEGSLVSIHDGANADLTSRVDVHLKVMDFRPRDELFGQPARYSVSENAWPEIGSDAYRRMVVTNKSHILKHVALQPAKPNRNWPVLVFILVLFLFLAPLGALLSWRSRIAKDSQQHKQQRPNQ